MAFGNREYQIEISPLPGRRLAVVFVAQPEGKVTLGLDMAAAVAAAWGAELWAGAAVQDAAVARKALAAALDELAAMAPAEFRGLLLDAVRKLAGRDPEAVLALAREIALAGYNARGPCALMVGVCAEAKGGDGGGADLDYPSP